MANFCFARLFRPPTLLVLLCGPKAMADCFQAFFLPSSSSWCFCLFLGFAFPSVFPGCSLVESRWSKTPRDGPKMAQEASRWPRDGPKLGAR